MRLLPRFSLRFLLLALTIFLIGVGVAVKYWRAYQEHERVASKLEALGFDVEEEYDTLFGWVIGKRITGLQTFTFDRVGEVAAALREIPNKPALRKLAFRYSHYGPLTPPLLEETEQSRALNQELLQAIGQLTALEILNFFIPDIPPGELQQLATLKQLRTLQFYDSLLPAGEARALLEQLPNLERLQIGVQANWSHADIEDLLLAKMPNLRQLWIIGFLPQSSWNKPANPPSPAERKIRLDLTRQGLGRSPNLEYLNLYDIHFHEVVLEAGSLPRLKILDLTGAEENTTVNWAELPRAAPSLNGIAIHRTQLTNSVVTLLDQFPLLETLHLAGMQRNHLHTLQKQWKLQPEALDTSELSHEIMRELFDRPVPLQFPENEYELRDSIPADYLGFVWPPWKIKQYRTQPQGGEID